MTTPALAVLTLVYPIDKNIKNIAIATLFIFE